MAKGIQIIAWCFGLSSMKRYAYYYSSMVAFKRENPYGCFGDCWRIIKNPSPEFIEKVKKEGTF